MQSLHTSHQVVRVMHKCPVLIFTTELIHRPVVPLSITVKSARIQLLSHTLIGQVASSRVFAGAVVALSAARLGVFALVVSATAGVGAVGGEA